MSHKTAATVAHTIGIDTGKNTLHLIGLDDKGAIVLREKVVRDRITTRLANVPRCLIGIEAGRSNKGVDRTWPNREWPQRRSLSPLEMKPALRANPAANLLRGSYFVPPCWHSVPGLRSPREPTKAFTVMFATGQTVPSFPGFIGCKIGSTKSSGDPRCE